MARLALNHVAIERFAERCGICYSCAGSGALLYKRNDEPSAEQDECVVFLHGGA